MAFVLAILQVLPIGETAEAHMSRRGYYSDDRYTEGYFNTSADFLSEPDLPWSNPDRPDYYGILEERAARQRTRRCVKCRSRSQANVPVVVSRYQAREIRQSIPPSDFMRRMANAATRYGRAERGYCYRGVKRIIAAVDPSLAKFFAGSRRAIYAMRDLKRAGFRNDMNSCWRPGVVRVYRGPADGLSPRAAESFMLRHFGIRGTAGDYAGHIEVLGSDRRWHHFTGSGAPINHPSHFGPQRRKLVGCFVK